MTVPLKIRTLPTPQASSDFNSEKFLNDCEQLGIKTQRIAVGVWRLTYGVIQCDFTPFSSSKKLTVHKLGVIYALYDNVPTSLVLEVVLGVVDPEGLLNARRVS